MSDSRFCFFFLFFFSFRFLVDFFRPRQSYKRYILQARSHRRGDLPLSFSLSPGEDRLRRRRNSHTEFLPPSFLLRHRVHRAVNRNAIFLQVRPQVDHVRASSLPREHRIRHQAAYRPSVNPQYPNLRSYTVALLGCRIIRLLS